MEKRTGADDGLKIKLEQRSLNVVVEFEQVYSQWAKSVKNRCGGVYF